MFQIGSAAATERLRTWRKHYISMGDAVFVVSIVVDDDGGIVAPLLLQLLLFCLRL